MLQWIWVYRYLFKIVLLSPSNIYPEMWLLDHIIVLFSLFWVTSLQLSTVTTPIHILSNSVQGFSFVHILTNTGFLLTDILTCVRWYLVILICISLIVSDFHVPVGHLYILFGKTSHKPLRLFKNHVVWIVTCLLLSCMSSLYILYINLLLDGLQIFPPVCRLPFYSVDYFAVEKAFKFDVFLFVYFLLLLVEL